MSDYISAKPTWVYEGGFCGSSMYYECGKCGKKHHINGSRLKNLPNSTTNYHTCFGCGSKNVFKTTSGNVLKDNVDGF